MLSINYKKWRDSILVIKAAGHTIPAGRRTGPGADHPARQSLLFRNFTLKPFKQSELERLNKV